MVLDMWDVQVKDNTNVQQFCFEKTMFFLSHVISSTMKTKILVLWEFPGQEFVSEKMERETGNTHKACVCLTLFKNQLLVKTLGQ